MQTLTLREICSDAAGTLLRSDCGDRPISRISLDSRTLQEGDLFWAVEGKRTDGHRYLKDAIKAGAAGVVVRHGMAIDSVPCVEVADTTAALGLFAREYRRRMDALVIGVTGSVGKTTTRRMIHHVLSSMHSGVTNEGNFNNEFGVPLSLLEIAPDHEFAVIELAASGPDQIAPLVATSLPEIGVITNIAECHLEGFGDLDTVCRTKCALLRDLPETGTVVINGDDPRLVEAAIDAECHVIRVGEGAGNDIVATVHRSDSTGTSFSVPCKTGSERAFRLRIPGRHHLTAALASIAIADEIGMPTTKTREALQSFAPVGGRCEPVTIGSWTVINDSYNASPQSVSAAIDMLSAWPTSGRRHLILGDMLELGEEAEKRHFTIGQKIGRTEIDSIIAHGIHSHSVTRGVKETSQSHIQRAATSTLETLILNLELIIGPGDVILVKGSRGMRMERLLDTLREWAAISDSHIPLPNQIPPTRRIA